MRIGIVQPIAGNVGGRDKLLGEIIKTLSDHDLTLFTFSKPLKKFSIPVRYKIPFKMPFLGIYQSLLMPKFKFDNIDIVITAIPIKSDKPIIVYDHSNEFGKETPKKYQHGFWKLYYLPYKFLRNVEKPNPNATYTAISNYTAKILSDTLKVECKVLYPPINLDGIKMRAESKINQVVVAGRITPEKNLTKTIEILNEVKHPCIITGVVTKIDTPYLNKLKSMAKDHIVFHVNPTRQELLEYLTLSRISFSAAKETFGIITVEAIASGCIPIVPDNSAHPEIVPFTSLRYLSDQDAVTMLNVMMNIDASLLVTKLQEHIKQFTIDNFKINMNKLLEEKHAV